MKAAKKQLSFKESPRGVQLHAGLIDETYVWHSDDLGRTWWSGCMFSHSYKMTKNKLLKLCKGIIKDLEECPKVVRTCTPLNT